jgi:hypothetical protein
MARSKANGNGRLEEAMALLIHNQAAFVAGQRETDTRIAELERRMEERFQRIENMLLEHNRILLEHNRILEALPEAMRDKFGFRAPGT